jgi:hypothetical protein
VNGFVRVVLFGFLMAWSTGAGSQQSAKPQQKPPPIEKQVGERDKQQPFAAQNQQITPQNTPVIININPPSVGNEKAAEAKKNPEPEGYKNWMDRWIGEPINILTAALALGTFLLVYVTKQIVSVTRNNAILTQRAFVFLRHFDGRHTVTGGRIDTMRILPQWENGGQTPTRKMVAHVSYQWLDRAFNDDTDFRDLDSTGAVIPGGAKGQIMLIGPGAAHFSAAIDVDPTCIASILDHRGHLYIWGWATYDDVFPKTLRHRTEFCVEFIIIQEPSETAFRFPLYGRHNCADEECEKQGCKAAT